MLSHSYILPNERPGLLLTRSTRLMGTALSQLLLGGIGKSLFGSEQAGMTPVGRDGSVDKRLWFENKGIKGINALLYNIVGEFNSQ